jgi:hemophore-related protein
MDQRQFGDKPMNHMTRIVRRAAAGTLVGGATAAMLCGLAPLALADPPPPPAPGCSAGDFEQLKAQVSAATADYMFSHPDVNAFFSTLKGQPRDQVRGEVQTYLNANPQAKTDLAGIRQPLRDMRDRCR